MRYLVLVIALLTAPFAMADELTNEELDAVDEAVKEAVLKAQLESAAKNITMAANETAACQAYFTIENDISMSLKFQTQAGLILEGAKRYFNEHGAEIANGDQFMSTYNYAVEKYATDSLLQIQEAHPDEFNELGTLCLDLLKHLEEQHADLTDDNNADEQ